MCSADVLNLEMVQRSNIDIEITDRQNVNKMTENVYYI
jgi:hypothetical protein